MRPRSYPLNFISSAVFGHPPDGLVVCDLLVESLDGRSVSTLGGIYGLRGTERSRSRWRERPHFLGHCTVVAAVAALFAGFRFFG
jgi:hypothetical protein